MHASMVKPQDAVIVSVLAAVLALGLTLATPTGRLTGRLRFSHCAGGLHVGSRLSLPADFFHVALS